MEFSEYIRHNTAFSSNIISNWCDLDGFGPMHSKIYGGGCYTFRKSSTFSCRNHTPHWYYQRSSSFQGMVNTYRSYFHPTEHCIFCYAFLIQASNKNNRNIFILRFKIPCSKTCKFYIHTYFHSPLTWSNIPMFIPVFSIFLQCRT